MHIYANEVKFPKELNVLIVGLCHLKMFKSIQQTVTVSYRITSVFHQFHHFSIVWHSEGLISDTV